MKKKFSLFDSLNTIFMLLVVCVTIYPMYFTVIASISDASAIATGKVLWKPVGVNMEAYKHVFAYEAIWTGYLNTIFYTVVGTLLSIVLTIPAGYALSKKYLPFRNTLMTFFLITMYVGGGMIPCYLLRKNLGLIDTRAVIILASSISIYNMIVTRTFFTSGISDSLYEAAEIDGAGELRRFFSIALPLAKSIIAVMTLYYAVALWNDYFSALLYISDARLEPLQSVLRRVLLLNQNALDTETLNQMSIDAISAGVKRAYMAYTMKYAMVFFASAPLLAAYPFVQKHFVKGVMIGALKE